MTWSRRRFIRTVGVAGAGLAAGVLHVGCAGRRPGGRRPRRLLADIHAHAALDDWNDLTPFARRYPVIVDALTPIANRSGVDWARCHAAGVDMVCAAHYNIFDEMASMPVDPSPDAPRHTAMMIDQLEAHLRGPGADYARVAHSRDALEHLLSVDKRDPSWRTAVVHALEGAHALGGDLENVAVFARRGVFYMTITHFLDRGVGSTANALPFFPDMGPQEPAGGLSGFGRELIAEMDRARMTVDVTHLTSRSIDDVLSVSGRPLMASHASARALGIHPYSLTDEHIIEITRRGGLVGVLLYPLLLSNYSGPAEARRWGSLRDTIRTIRHIVKVCGSHAGVAVGSDFGAYITPPAEMRRLGDAGILRSMLLEEFGDEALVEDVMANNAIRFLLENWGHRA